MADKKQYIWVKPGSVGNSVPKVGSDVSGLIGKLQDGVVKTLLDEGFIEAKAVGSKKKGK